MRSAARRGLIAEAARIADFARPPETAGLRSSDLSRPVVDADIDLGDGGDGIALRWADMQLTDGSFGKRTAGSDRIDGRSHGPGPEEAWGVFDTGAHVGAFGAKRE